MTLGHLVEYLDLLSCWVLLSERWFICLAGGNSA